MGIGYLYPSFILIYITILFTSGPIGPLMKRTCSHPPVLSTGAVLRRGMGMIDKTSLCLLLQRSTIYKKHNISPSFFVSYILISYYLLVYDMLYPILFVIYRYINNYIDFPSQWEINIIRCRN